MAPPRYEVIGVEGLPEVGRGADLAAMIEEAARRQGTPLADRDLLVVSQKIVSKAEGRVVRLSAVEPSERARDLALALGRGLLLFLGLLEQRPGVAPERHDEQGQQHDPREQTNLAAERPPLPEKQIQQQARQQHIGASFDNLRN